jgi:hypothetical protein
VRQASDQPDHHRKVEALGKVEGFPGHLVSLLLVGRLETENAGEVGVEPGVLFILG